ncbi:nucleotidyltransferase [Candidatus Berkelbacteria bacterium]|nr:nucleotidyltransferase [Candidatus Berkelbacteria bacterium]
MKPTLLVLAAGMGSRYGGLKQVDSVGPGGQTIIDYSVYDAIRAGFGKVVFVIREEFADQFRQKVSDKYQDKIETAEVFQALDSFLPSEFELPPNRVKPWGTGHAILVAESAINEPFLMINADDFYGQKSFAAMSEFLQKDPQPGFAESYGMVGFILRNTLSEHGTVSRGVCELDDRSNLTSVVEFTKIAKRGEQAVHTDDLGEEYLLKGNEIVSMNMWGFQPSIFGHLKHQFHQFLNDHGFEEKSEFYIPSVVNSLINEKEATVKVLPTAEQWFGLTYKKDLLFAQEQIGKLIKEGRYPENLF